MWFFSLAAWQQALLASLFMYAMTALGAACVFFSRRPKEGALTLLLGASAGIMIAASFFSLLLPAIEAEGALPAYIPASVGFLLGGAFSNTYDRLSRGYVVDYLRLRTGIGAVDRVVFNLADFAILIGAMCVALAQKPE